MRLAGGIAVRMQWSTILFSCACCCVVILVCLKPSHRSLRLHDMMLLCKSMMQRAHCSKPARSSPDVMHRCGCEEVTYCKD